MTMMTDGRELRQPRWRRPDDLKGDRSFCQRSIRYRVMSFRYEVKRALRMYMLRSLSNDTKKCDTHVYTSFFQPLIR